MSVPSSPLFNKLREFLESKTKVEYPEMAVNIVQLDPLRITDDNKYFLEISSLMGQLEEQIQEEPSLYKLVLKQWQFDFRRVPNSEEFYYDINCRDFKVVKLAKKPKLSAGLKRISENKAFEELYEAKKRQVTAKKERTGPVSGHSSRPSASPIKKEKQERPDKFLSSKKSSTKKSEYSSRPLPRAIKKVFKSKSWLT